MTERTLGKVLATDRERNARRTRWAIAAANLHDNLMDIVKMFNDIEPHVGCRALVGSGASPGFLELHAEYLADPRMLDLRQLIELVVQEHKELYPTEFGVYDVLDRGMPGIAFERMGEAFIECFVSNSTGLKLVQTDTYEGEQLKLVTTRALAKGETLRGLAYFLFPLAPEHQAMIADETQLDVRGITRKDSDGSKFLHLGPSFLVNHHCDEKACNVNYIGSSNRPRKTAGSVKVHQPISSRAVAEGEELLADYGTDDYSRGKLSNVNQRRKGHAKRSSLCTATYKHLDRLDEGRPSRATRSTSNSTPRYRYQDMSLKRKRGVRKSDPFPLPVAKRVVLKFRRPGSLSQGLLAHDSADTIYDLPRSIDTGEGEPNTTASSPLTSASSATASDTQQTPVEDTSLIPHEKSESEIEYEELYGEPRYAELKIDLSVPASVVIEEGFAVPKDGPDIQTWLSDIGGLD